MIIGWQLSRRSDEEFWRVREFGVAHGLLIQGREEDLESCTLT